MAGKVRELYKNLCETEWNATVTGVLIGFFSVLLMAWWRPWGIVGALRNWGDWCMYGLTPIFRLESGVFQYYTEAPESIFIDSGSVIGFAFVLGAFISACLGKEFALRVPPTEKWSRRYSPAS